MSLATDLRTAAKQAMTAVDSVTVTMTYTQVAVGSTYDPATDTLNDVNTDHTGIKAVKCKVREDEMDWTPIKAEVAKFIIAYIDLPIEPKTTDYFVVNGERWEIRRLRPIPGQPIHIIFAES